MSDPAPSKIEQAFFTIKGQSDHLAVDFNPVSLQFNVTNQSQGEGGRKVQHVTSSSAKLDLDLIFDSTNNGEDVRKRTQPLELLMKPGDDKAPPGVVFEWGAFKFDGFVDSFKQTLDFFSKDGIPLRASVTLSISQPDYTFDQGDSGQRAQVDNTLDLGGGSPLSLAAAGGDVSAARLIASANGLESLRADAGVAVSVGGGVSIGAAAGVSAGAGIGGGFSAGAGLSAGISAGVGAGVSLGISAGAGVGVSAGGTVGAAFAGLQTGGGASAGLGAKFDPGKILEATSTPAVSVGGEFDVGGKASLASGASFKADVSGGVRFDEV